MKKIYGVLIITLAGLVLAGCENLGAGVGASEERITALETELGTLREEFTAFQGQWDGFYQDWGTYRDQIGLGEQPLPNTEGQ